MTQPTIISHNGASGDFPGCTMLSYAAAVKDGADYIDCSVQITSDGVLICREFPDLVQSTNVFTNSVLYSTYLATYPAIQSAQGVFTFDMSWANVSTLRGNLSLSPIVMNILEELFAALDSGNVPSVHVRQIF